MLDLFVGTWNLNNQNPHDDVGQLISPSKKYNADFIVLGLQESYTCVIEKWEYSIHKAIGSNYVMKAKRQLGKIYLFAFVRCELQQFIIVHGTESVLLSTYTILKTKGAITFAITVFGRNFLFVTTHLIPHQFNSERRTEDIIGMMRLLGIRNKYFLRNNQGMH